jgi:hypothetical protein
MKPQVHIIHFSGTMFTTNVCIVEEILCKCRQNVLSYVWFLPVSSLKLLFNNLLTSGKYIIWSDREHMFDNHLPDVVLYVSDFPLPIKEYVWSSMEASSLYRWYEGNKIASKLFVMNFLLPCHTPCTSQHGPPCWLAAFENQSCQYKDVTYRSAAVNSELSGADK